ncbi:hypothetical protein SEA_MAGRITTE_200 [Microbacterium phage Magritte]|nr:hypothetical protein SEA_MAGRITTE_200 [Microbacterium phage Magritte]
MADQYPESEKLSHQRSEWSTLVDFMEFLATKHIRLMTYEERADEVTCPGTIFNGCDGGRMTRVDVDDKPYTTARTCDNCKGTGKVIDRFEGFMDVNSSTNNLIYEHLEVDPSKLEAERRAMLSSLS